MHLMITKRTYKGKVAEHAKIVESYREKGKTPRKRTILNLGTIKSEADRKRFQQIAFEMKKGNEFVKLKEIILKDAKEFGVTYTTNSLLEKYGVAKTLKENLSKNKADFDIYEIIKALIINRLVKPSSDLSAVDWIKKHYPEELKIKRHNIYRALDYLQENKEEIEKEVFLKLKEKLNLDTENIHYDLTSSYFEGNSCSIAMFGYSRDKRNDKKQVIIGLAMAEGIPIQHEVYEGNKVDKQTLTTVTEKLKNLGIKNPTFIADIGLLTANNIKELEDNKFRFLLGYPRRNNNIAKELLIKDIKTDKEQDAIEIKEENKRRYILCIDENTKKERLKTLEKIKERLERELKELQNKKTNKESLIIKTSKLLGKNKRLFDLNFVDNFKFSLNEENYEYEKKIAGKFLLVTNTSLEPKEAMKSYKELQTVENAFDEIKNFLEIRPIYHWKEQRVKAHVFICILAFLIECIIERFTKQTARKVINELETIKLINLQTNITQKRMITELSPKAEHLFSELSILKPIVTNI